MDRKGWLYIFGAAAIVALIGFGLWWMFKSNFTAVPIGAFYVSGLRAPMPNNVVSTNDAQPSEMGLSEHERKDVLSDIGIDANTTRSNRIRRMTVSDSPVSVDAAVYDTFGRAPQEVSQYMVHPDVSIANQSRMRGYGDPIRGDVEITSKPIPGWAHAEVHVQRNLRPVAPTMVGLNGNANTQYMMKMERVGQDVIIQPTTSTANGVVV